MSDRQNIPVCCNYILKKTLHQNLRQFVSPIIYIFPFNFYRKRAHPISGNTNIDRIIVWFNFVRIKFLVLRLAQKDITFNIHEVSLILGVKLC